MEGVPDLPFYTNFSPKLDVELQIGDFSEEREPTKTAAVVQPKVNDGLDLDLIFEERGLDIYYMEQIIQQHQEAKEIQKMRISAKKSEIQKASQPSSPVKIN